MASLLVAAAIAASALLPSMLPQRAGLLAVGAALAVWVILWFHVIPRSWLGSARPIVAMAVAQLLAVALLIASGGAATIFFGYYAVPVLASVQYLRPRLTMAVGAFGLALYLFVAITVDPGGATRDTAVIRSTSYVAVVAVASVLARALKKVSADLATERSRLTTVIASLKDPLVVSIGGVISSANEAALTFFGRSLVGRRLMDVVPPGGQARLHDATGREHAVEVVTSRLPGGGGESVTVVHDVSHLVEASRMREQLLYNVAHELRGPLAVLDTSLDLVQADLGSLTMAEVYDLLGRSRRSVARMRTLMDDLLSAGNIQAGRFLVQPQDIALAPVVRESVDTVAPVTLDRGQRVVIDVADDLRVRADARYLRQVLHNLLSNASAYGGAGTEIAVRGRRVEPNARLSVEDRGPGIPPEQQTGLFERFYRVRGTSDGGVGLGLAIAKGIVEAHGGRIGVDSEPGRGTAVWFTVPLVGASR